MCTGQQVKVADEHTGGRTSGLTMMIVVLPRVPNGTERQHVAAMAETGCNDALREPEVLHGHVTLQQDRPQHQRNAVAECKFDGMRVLGRQSHRGLEQMVALVDVLVQVRVVEQPVQIVEAELPDQRKDNQVPQARKRIRKFVRQ